MLERRINFRANFNDMYGELTNFEKKQHHSPQIHSLHGHRIS